ncbi:MAG: hypothetical protein OIF55_14615 [Amphritea sp.]|nr:hypothetical protein [Amphritea sp.]
MKISASVGLSQFKSDMTDLLKAEEKALAKALSWTAFDARFAIQREISEVFEDPTPWARRSVYVQKATPGKPVAHIGLAKGGGRVNASWEYLAGLFTPHIEGGQRKFKRSEGLLRHRRIIPKGMQAVPGAGARLNRYGNMSRGQVIKVLSNLQAHDERGFLANTRSARNRTHFVKRDATGTPIGIWQRKPGGGVIPVLAFVKRATYSPRFDFYGVIRKVRDTQFKDKYSRALKQELSKL